MTTPEERAQLMDEYQRAYGEKPPVVIYENGWYTIGNGPFRMKKRHKELESMRNFLIWRETQE